MEKDQENRNDNEDLLLEYAKKELEKYQKENEGEEEEK